MMLRPPHTLRLLLVLLTLVLVSACAGGEGGVAEEVAEEATETESPPAASTPTERDPAAPEVDGTVTGEFGGSSIEGGCVWLDAEDGTRFELVAGPDARVAIDPQNRVVATLGGEVIAREGDQIRVTGMTDPGLLTFCQVGEILVVEDVEAL